MNNLLFPHELLPICSVPEEVLGPACLASYLLFTRTLEIAVINPQFVKISCNQLPWTVSGEFQKRAFIFYLEEANHAQWSQELLDKFFPDLDFADYQSNFPSELCKLKATYKAEDVEFFEFACFVASECLISQNLIRISTNKDVHPTVREYVVSHAKEEARHRTFCLELLAEVSRLWNSSQKCKFLEIAMDFSNIFLGYDEILLRKITKAKFCCKGRDERRNKTILTLNNTLSGALA